MLKRLLLALDVLLVVASGALGVHLYQIWTAAPAAAAAPAGPPTAAAPEAPAGPPRSPTAPPVAFGVIADRNLFSPTRAEVAAEPPKPTTTASASAIPARLVEKPRLYGVVLGTDGGSRAYLWDPQSKKVFGYKVGDSVAESRVEQIGPDRVVLRRSAETFEVLLRDPSKPRPPAAPVAVPPAAVPGQVPGIPPGGPQVPGTPTEVEGAPPAPGAPPTVGVPGTTPPRLPPTRPGLPGFVPGRPPLRVPQGVPGGQPTPAQPPQSGNAGS
jgi:Type II secretion system protein C